MSFEVDWFKPSLFFFPQVKRKTHTVRQGNAPCKVRVWVKWNNVCNMLSTVLSQNVIGPPWSLSRWDVLDLLVVCLRASSYGSISSPVNQACVVLTSVCIRASLRGHAMGSCSADISGCCAWETHTSSLPAPSLHSTSHLPSPVLALRSALCRS